MTTIELECWLRDTAWKEKYWDVVKKKSMDLKSDGCSGVPDWFIWSCWEHDIHYRTHKMVSGQMIDRRTADYILRVRIQQGSILGGLSPMSWWRWAAVRLCGRTAWEGNA